MGRYEITYSNEEFDIGDLSFGGLSGKYIGTIDLNIIVDTYDREFSIAKFDYATVEGKRASDLLEYILAKWVDANQQKLEDHFYDHAGEEAGWVPARADYAEHNTMGR